MMMDTVPPASMWGEATPCHLQMLAESSKQSGLVSLALCVTRTLVARALGCARTVLFAGGFGTVVTTHRQPGSTSSQTASGAEIGREVS